jgi:homoserine kinase type II
MSPTLETARTRILARYGTAVAHLRWLPIGAGGGFSGAQVWRGEEASGSPLFALKAWPELMTVEQVEPIHRWMTQVSHLPFVPALIRTTEFSTSTTEAGRVWDVCRWMPGAAVASPSRPQIESACAAIASLHRVWRAESSRQPCPGVLRRLSLLDEFRSLPWEHRPVHAKLDPLLIRAQDLAIRFPRADLLALRTWANVPVLIHPCVRDLRSDHVLFGHDRVTGIIDYGAMAIDHPGVDLARFLGDCVGDDDGAVAAGIASYRDAGGVLDVPDEFVRLLDRTGVFCSLIGWLRRTLIVHQSLGDPTAVASRLAQLVARGENFVPE